MRKISLNHILFLIISILSNINILENILDNYYNRNNFCHLKKKNCNVNQACYNLILIIL